MDNANGEETLALGHIDQDTKRKLDLVLRLFRGEGLEQLSRDASVSREELTLWRRNFFRGGLESLKESSRDLVVAFLLLGFLIGNIIGLTAASVTTSLIALLFAFGGGSAVAFMKQLEAGERRAAGKAVAALSISCLLGLYFGIYVTEAQLLTPSRIVSSEAQTSVTDRKYLRSNALSELREIDQALDAGEINAAVAYQTLREMILDE
ncbi:MAG: NAD(P)(+) transhydrogenase (Re/Si-specific) subunit beta [bacterium]|nr:NAD(P)(+) transhydrogenase (Re/Si-specific) subunit beta [bacterium]